jgi:hypothetical protein
VALQSYLSDEKLARPTAVLSPPGEVQVPEVGYVVPSFERGALILMDSEDRIFRLSWSEAGEEAKSADRRRSLLAGKYRLLGYRLHREDEEGERWDLSASHPKLRTIEIAMGKTLEVEISESIRMSYRLTSRQFGVSVFGGDDSGAEGRVANSAGLTIYKAGKRIPISFALQDKDGQARFEGRIRYG